MCQLIHRLSTRWKPALQGEPEGDAGKKIDTPATVVAGVVRPYPETFLF